MTAGDDPPGTRGGLSSVSQPSPSDKRQKKWAVLVGVSKYSDSTLNLKYADRDAKELWKVLRSRCGLFVEERTKILVNEDATQDNVAKALRSFLEYAEEEDCVVVHFSCHAAPNPRRREHLYFLTHDTKRDDIAGTALGFDDVVRWLGRPYLKAKNVIVLADTCFSGALEPGDKGASSMEDIERYLGQQQVTRSGLSWLSSSRHDEKSRELDKLQHGIFSYLVIKGLAGEADNGNGVVTVGTLVDYLRRRTPEYSAQQPTVNKTYDIDFPMSWIGDIKAQDRAVIGLEIFRMAVELQDKRRFESAAWHLSSAADLAWSGPRSADSATPQARMHAGLAYWGAGNMTRACEQLQRACDEDRQARESGQTGYPDATLLLGAALARAGDTARAIRTLEVAAREHDVKHRRELAGSLATLLRTRTAQPFAPSPNRKPIVCALLVGISRYLEDRLDKLQGPKQDVQMIRELLQESPWAASAKIVRIEDAGATREQLITELRRLQSVSPDDVVLIAFSGHALENHPEGYLLLHDSRFAGQGIPASGPWTNAVSAHELHELVNAIPARDKLLLLDTHPNTQFFELAEGPGVTYSALVAASPGQWAKEVQVAAHEGTTLPVAGVMTYALVQTLRELGPNACWEDVLPRVMDRILAPVEQTPVLVGQRRTHVLYDGPDLVDFDAIRALEVSLFGESNGVPLGDVLEEYRHAIDGLPELHVAMGRALVSRGDLRAARAVLERGKLRETWSSLGPRTRLEAAWWLSYTYARVRQPMLAAVAVRDYCEIAEQLNATPDLGAPCIPPDELKRDLTTLLEHAATSRLRALVVGVDNYRAVEVPRSSGAVADAQSFRHMLVEEWGINEQDVTLLTNDTATTATILEKFRELAAQTRDAPGIFYFAGCGSSRAILGVDGRTETNFDISLSDLISAARDTSLGCVIDADLEAPREPSARYVPADLRAAGMRDAQPAGDDLWAMPIGRAVIYARPGKRITADLVRRSTPRSDNPLTWNEWTGGAPRIPLLLRAVAPDDPIVYHATGWASIEALLAKLRAMSWEHVAASLGTMLQDSSLPEAHRYRVDLGVTHAMLTDFPAAKDQLERAVEEAARETKAAADAADTARADPQMRSTTEAKVAKAAAGEVEARYQLGRILVLAGVDLGRAQAELSRAAQLEPNDPTIQYYLGKAIHDFLAKVGIEEVRRAWQLYVDQDAPLGHRHEVQSFLRSRERSSPFSDDA